MKIMRICPECAGSFERKHGRQMFCQKAHSVAFNNRQLSRGQALVSLMQAWRAARHSKDPADKAVAKIAFAKLCRAIDEANASDKSAGRMNPVKLYKARDAMGLID